MVQGQPEVPTKSRREQLHDLLKEILGSTNVYYQSPADVSMSYPAIVYSKDDIDVEFADNSPYRLKKRYIVTVVSAKPDHPAVDKLAALPLCTFSRWYPADNLNHDVFSLYF
jgi:hypothetical protein